MRVRRYFTARRAIAAACVTTAALLAAPATAFADIAPIQDGGSSSDCYYNGQRYSEGAVVNQGGTNKTCMSGRWV